MLDIVNKGGGSIKSSKKQRFCRQEILAVYRRFRAINLPKSTGIEQLIAAPG
jgi:hypothetical protein